MGTSCARMLSKTDMVGSSRCLSSPPRQGRTESLRRIGRREDLVHFRRIAVGRMLLIPDESELLARFLGLALTVPHAGIEAVLSEQLAVGAALGDASFVEHDDI